MSKTDESSWITLSITVTPDDFMELEDTISDLRWQAGTSSGFLEHIVEQYKLKKQALDLHEARHTVAHILHTRKLT